MQSHVGHWRISALVVSLLCALASSARAQGAGDAIVYYDTDAIGSVRFVSNAAGQMVERHDYLPFGQEWPGDAGVSKRKFAGKEHDGETGFDYFGARYLSSSAGRFTTVDPKLNAAAALAQPQRWARYPYAGNNPLRFVDPDGADFWDFAYGVGDALRANIALGVGRSNGGNRDFRIGQSIGDAVSFLTGAAETMLGGPMMGGGVVACGSGVGCLAGAPAIAGGALLATHGIGMSTAAGVSFMEGSGDGGSRSRATGEATPTTDKNQFESVRGTSGKKNRATGEIWVKDPFHKDHYEVYKNKKDFENGDRSRAVWEDGRLKEKF